MTLRPFAVTVLAMAGTVQAEDQSWAVFLGTSHHEGNASESRAAIQKATNPFTGKPFGDVPVLVFGQSSPPAEIARVVVSHLDVPFLSKTGQLQGQSYGAAVCHSNGCTELFQAQRQGTVHVEKIFAFGADWTSRNFRPGELKGAEVVFFTAERDPIWKILAPTPKQITENTPGFAIELPFNKISEIPQRAVDLIRKGRADTDTYPVVRLETPKGNSPHHLVENYLAETGKWMESGGTLQRKIAGDLESIRPPQPRAGPADTRGGVKVEIKIGSSDIRRK